MPSFPYDLLWSSQWENIPKLKTLDSTTLTESLEILSYAENKVLQMWVSVRTGDLGKIEKKYGEGIEAISSPSPSEPEEVNQKAQ